MQNRRNTLLGCVLVTGLALPLLASADTGLDNGYMTIHTQMNKNDFGFLDKEYHGWAGLPLNGAPGNGGGGTPGGNPGGGGTGSIDPSFTVASITGYCAGEWDDTLGGVAFHAPFRNFEGTVTWSDDPSNVITVTSNGDGSANIPPKLLEVVPDEYDLTITLDGTFDAMTQVGYNPSFPEQSTNSNHTCINEVSQWGENTGVTSLTAAFTRIESPVIAPIPASVINIDYILESAGHRYPEPSFIDLSDWDTSNVTSMRGTFANSGFSVDSELFTQTGSVITMEDMFHEYLPGWANDEDYPDPFVGELAALEGWDVSNVENFSRMFDNSVSGFADLSAWETTSAINMDQMFNDNNVMNFDLTQWDVSSVTSMDNFMGGRSESAGDPFYSFYLYDWPLLWVDEYGDDIFEYVGPCNQADLPPEPDWDTASSDEIDAWYLAYDDWCVGPNPFLP